MSPELRERIISYNKEIAERSEKAEDLIVLLTAISQLAPGQVKKLLFNQEVINLLHKYDIEVE